MRRLLRSVLVLGVAVSLLTAGCPTDPTNSAVGISTSSGGAGNGAGGSTGGGGSGGNGVPFVGPPASSGAAGNSTSSTISTGAGTGSSPVAVGGNVSTATATTDGLTVQYPGCELPQAVEYWRAEILRLVNEKRVEAGVGTVTRNETLEDQATQYACELIHDDFFAHVSPVTGSTLRDRAKEFGYEYWIIGENLAAGQRSPVEAVTGWMNSPCHRENVLNPAFTELGVGVRVGGDYGIYWVQEFGRPLSLSPYPGPTYKDPECTHTE